MSTRPFLKWAGGKRQLLPVLRRYYPRDFGAYYEPFLGSGAVFFDLQAAGLLAGRPVVLSDTNRDIVGCYLAIRDHLERLIAYLRRLAAGHAAHGAAHYYDVRDQQFNPTRQRLYARHQGVMPSRYPTELAAMFIYLNRTGYNGLFRLNRRGGFNVPAGRYTNPRICDVETLHRVHEALGRSGVTVRHASFDHVGACAQPGDFLYFDPPYAPLSATARFTAYTADGFDEQAQERLQRLLVALAGRGCQVLLSNSSAPMILSLYEDRPEVRAAGLDVVQVPARRAINSHAGRRGPVSESLIMNLPARELEEIERREPIRRAPAKKAGVPRKKAGKTAGKTARKSAGKTAAKAVDKTVGKAAKRKVTNKSARKSTRASRRDATRESGRESASVPGRNAAVQSPPRMDQNPDDPAVQEAASGEASDALSAAARRAASKRGRTRQLGVDSSSANGGRLRVLRRTARQV